MARARKVERAEQLKRHCCVGRSRWRRPARSQPAHWFPSCFEAVVVVLDPIVCVSGGVMKRIREQLIRNVQQWSSNGGARSVVTSSGRPWSCSVDE
jgi:hypothetical protein